MIVSRARYDELSRKFDLLSATCADALATADELHAQTKALGRENATLRKRLAVFTAPRARGAGGRFVKGAGK